MNSRTVPVLLFRLDGHRLAAELQLVSSVLAPHEAEGMVQLDPRPHLLGPDGDPDRLEPLGGRDRLGLLDIPGPPTAVWLGEVLGARELTTDDLLPAPPWLAEGLPGVLEPACARIDQKVVWLLDLDTLNQTPSS